MRKPSGDIARGVTLQDLLDEAKPLDAVAEACATCPAGFTREFACHRRIRYPIPEHVEAVADGAAADVARVHGGRAARARPRASSAGTGAPAAKLRAAGDTYFESRVAYGVRWDGENGGVIEMSSDQLFQMMFMVGPARADALA